MFPAKEEGHGGPSPATVNQGRESGGEGDETNGSRSGREGREASLNVSHDDTGTRGHQKRGRSFNVYCTQWLARKKKKD